MSTPESLKVRRPEQEELPDLVRIAQVSGFPKFTQAFLDRSFRSGQYRWFCLGQPIAAFAVFVLAAPEAELHSLAVAPTVRAQGLGRRLLSQSLWQVSKLGVQDVFLEVSEANLGARRLYEGLSFETYGMRRQYYQDGSTALLMRWSSEQGPIGDA